MGDRDSTLKILQEARPTVQVIVEEGERERERMGEGMETIERVEIFFGLVVWVRGVLWGVVGWSEVLATKT